MGNKLTKAANKHANYVPSLDETISDSYDLPTGAVFIPMSNVTGDLPIHNIPKIINNNKLDKKDYQDCIYEINRRSIHRYARLCSVLKRVETGKAPWELYYHFLERLINEVELICIDLNRFVLKEYNLLFIPFLHILRDETNNQHFGIIIDTLNKPNKNKNNKNKKRKQAIMTGLFSCFSNGGHNMKREMSVQTDTGTKTTERKTSDINMESSNNHDHTHSGHSGHNSEETDMTMASDGSGRTDTVSRKKMSNDSNDSNDSRQSQVHSNHSNYHSGSNLGSMNSVGSGILMPTCQSNDSTIRQSSVTPGPMPPILDSHISSVNSDDNEHEDSCLNNNNLNCDSIGSSSNIENSANAAKVQLQIYIPKKLRIGTKPKN